MSSGNFTVVEMMGFAEFTQEGRALRTRWLALRSKRSGSAKKIVDEKKWMMPEEFNETVLLSQILAGPNVVNMAMVFGSRMRGVGLILKSTLQTHALMQLMLSS